MGEIFEVDLYSERILLDDAWMGVEDLTAELRRRLERGDYRVSRLSDALERLQTVLHSMRRFEVRLTREAAADFETVARNSGRSVEQVLHEALMAYLTSEEAAVFLFPHSRDTAAPSGTSPSGEPAPSDGRRPRIPPTDLDDQWFQDDPGGKF